MVRSKERCNIGNLDDIEYNPIDASNDTVQSKWSMSMVVLTPDCVSVVPPLMRSLEGIVDARDNKNEPGNWCDDLVSQDLIFGIRALGLEGVHSVNAFVKVIRYLTGVRHFGYVFGIILYYERK